MRRLHCAANGEHRVSFVCAPESGGADVWLLSPEPSYLRAAPPVPQQL